MHARRILATLALVALPGCDVRPGPGELPGRRLDARTDDASELSVLSWNVLLLPQPVGYLHGNACRARRIGARLEQGRPDADVVALQETFDTRATNLLADALEQRYPYQLRSRPRARGGRINGGVTLLSRYPIEWHEVLVFERCAGRFSNCRSRRGAILARVRIGPERALNVIATHLDAGTQEGFAKARAAQLSQLREAVDEHPTFSRWPTLLVGDLNVDGLRHAPTDAKGEATEWARMMRALGRRCPHGRPLCDGEPIDVWRATHGPWPYDASGTRAANTYLCSKLWLSQCEPLSEDERWRQRARLDYAMLESPPDRGRWITDAEAAHLPLADTTCGAPYLSDHKAVRVELELAPSSADEASSTSSSPR